MSMHYPVAQSRVVTGVSYPTLGTHNSGSTRMVSQPLIQSTTVPKPLIMQQSPLPATPRIIAASPVAVTRQLVAPSPTLKQPPSFSQVSDPAKFQPSLKPLSAPAKFQTNESHFEDDRIKPDVVNSQGIKAGPTPPGKFKVCVCGGAGGIGQPLSLLMTLDKNVKEVSVYDLSIAMVPPAGVAADLVHLENAVAVNGYVGELNQPPMNFTKDALTGCDLVLIPAGMPRKPGMTRDDLFKVNADIAKGLVEACAKYCPNAILCMIVNPVNSVVPAMAELYRKKGLDPKKIIGVTTLDHVRANKFVADMTGKHPKDVNVPVIGGHAGVTIMPVFSQDPAAATIDPSKIEGLDKRIQDAGTEVVNAKGGKGSATLAMAYAGARFASSILSGLAGKPTVECAYMLSDISELPYFASKVRFGKTGVEEVLPIGNLNAYEQKRLEEAKAQLKTEIDTGLYYAMVNELNL